MWFKPNGWKELSAADKEWVQETHKERPQDRLFQSVQQDRHRRIEFLYKNYKFSEWARQQAIQQAIAHDSCNALKTMLGFRGFYFSGSTSSDRDLIRSFFSSALSHPLQVWQTLYDINKTTSGVRLPEQEVFEIAAAGKPSVALIRYMLENAKHTDTVYFKSFMEHAVRHTVVNLETVLNYTAKFKDTQPILDNALLEAVNRSEEDKVKLLLANGADASHRNGLALQEAVKKKNQGIMNLLLPKMRLDLYGEDIMAALRQAKAEPSLIDQLEKAVWAVTVTAKQNKKFTLIDPYTVAEVQQLPASMRLTTLFNFKSCQQIFIVEKPGRENGLTMSVTSFNDIGDQNIIEMMRQKLVELGGTPEEGMRLVKPALHPKPPAL